MLAKFSGFNPKGPYLSLVKEKETFCVAFTYSVKRAREGFMSQSCNDGKETYKKSVMHVQSCRVFFFAVLVTVAVVVA